MRRDTVKMVCLVGPYQGQVLEYPRHVAEALLSSGQVREPEPESAPAVERATVPRPETPDFSRMTKAELVDVAEDRGLTVFRGDGKDGDPTKEDYLHALEG